MREILFRGKRLNGEWVEGSLLCVGGSCYVCPKIYSVENKLNMYSSIEVDPATVGQFTGLTDKNGKLIFDGDIISVEFPASEPPDGPGGVYFENAEVFFSAVYHGWYVRFSECDVERLFEYDNPSEVEVVGNCWDNPELLKGGLK